MARNRELGPIMNSSLNLFGQVVLFSCIPMILLLFAYLPPRRAVIAATIVSWLFLPNAGFAISGLPDYTKTSATTVGTLLGVFIFDFARAISFRPKWYDLPMIIWCAVSFFTSLSNDLGPYEGASSTVKMAILWGIPYFLGRVYLNDLEGCFEIAGGIVLGAAVYVPLCLWEIRMSPTLHYYVYGVSSYGEASRFGLGFRPVVFLASGLELGVWMGAGTVCSYALWASGALRRLWGFRFGWFVAAIAVTTVLSKSVGAIILATIGVTVFELIRRTKASWLAWLVILVPPVYVTVRTSGLWDGRSLVELTGAVLPDRKGSIQTRVESENLLVEKALQRPLLGWGGWGRNFAKNAGGRDTAITDGYWIIVLGTLGLVGLSAMTLTFMVPQALFYRRFPGAVWAQPEVAPAVALCLQIGLCMIDNLSNAMPNPLYAIAIGAMTGMTAIALPSARRDAATRLAQADALKDAGQIDAAEEAYAQAIGTYATAASDAGRDSEILSEAAYSCEALADLLAASPGRIAEAEPYLRSAIEIRETLAGAEPERTDSLERLAFVLEHLGRLHSTLGRFDEAERAWRRAVELHEGLATRFPATPKFTTNWAEGLNDLAWLLSTRPHVDVDTARTAAGLSLKAIELDPSRGGFWNTLGAANYHAGDYESAAAALLRSIDLNDGGTGCDYYLLAMTNVRLENFGAGLECFERGDDWMKVNAPNHPTLTHLRDQAAALLHI